MYHGFISFDWIYFFNLHCKLVTLRPDINWSRYARLESNKKEEIKYQYKAVEDGRRDEICAVRPRHLSRPEEC